MKKEQNGFLLGRKLLYGGFAVLGCTLCGIYGFTANRFNMSEILFLMAGGVMAGGALATVCLGLLLLWKEADR